MIRGGAGVSGCSSTFPLGDLIRQLCQGTELEQSKHGCTPITALADLSCLPPRLVGRPVRPVSTVGQVFPVQPVAAEAEAAHAETQDGADEESFGSLLGMKPTLRETFVRVEEPVDDHAPAEPVVVFPGQAAHTPPHAERWSHRLAMRGPV